MKYVLRLLFPLIVASLAFAGVGATAAVAAETPAVSFVGTYTVHVTIGTAHEKATLQINADGTAVATQNGNVAHWKASGPAPSGLAPSVPPVKLYSVVSVPPGVSLNTVPALPAPPLPVLP